MSRLYKKGGAGRHVQLAEWVLSSEGWSCLKPGPRALYVELKRRFNGSNNGELFLSYRDAAHALNVNRKTIGSYFHALTEHGFIVQTQGHCLGPSGVGQSGSYALTEYPLNGRPATKEFMSFKKQNPRPKITHSLSQKTDQAGVKNSLLENQKGKKRATFAQNDPLHRGKKRDIYTSSHMQDKKPEDSIVLPFSPKRGLCGKAVRLSSEPLSVTNGSLCSPQIGRVAVA